MTTTGQPLGQHPIPAGSSGQIPEALLEDLNTSQREAVEALAGPVLVVAGAGSGKTRVLTRRIAAHIATGTDPSRILAITFTNKAAGEMRGRVAELVGGYALDRMWVSTFHSACVRMLRSRGPIKWFSIIDQSDSLRIMRGVLQDLGFGDDQLSASFVRNVYGRISRAKNQLTVPEEDGRGGVGDAAAQAFGAYQRHVRAMKAYDFDDLLVETVRMLRNNAEARAYFSERFEYVLIDEYQDTNRAQYAIAYALAGVHRNICVVGDPDQSIYKFRGAAVEHINKFAHDWPDARVVVLDRNYRSTKNILEVANAVIAKNELATRAHLWTDAVDGEQVKLYLANDDRGEARFVVNRIKEMGQPGDHAVLYRTNAQSRVIEEALMEHGIAYRLVGGTRFYDRKEIKDAIAYLKFVMNPDDQTAFSRVVNTPRRGIGAVTVEKILNVARENDVDLYTAAVRAQDPGISGRGAKSISKFVEYCDKVKAAVEAEGPAAGLEVVLVGTTGSRASLRANLENTDNPIRALFDSMGNDGQAAFYLKSGSEDGQERVRNLVELTSAANQFQQGPAPATLGIGGMLADLNPHEQTEAFLEHIMLVSDLDTVNEADRTTVKLMTVHGAKGLEFPHVTIIGMEDGLMPSRFGSRQMTRADLEEERRLAYVAITRAEQTLALTRARKRFVFGQIEMYPESPFLKDVKHLLSTDVDVNATAMDRMSSFSGGQRSVPSGFRRKPRGAQPGAVPKGLRAGAQVTHPKWGVGVVSEVVGSPDDPEVTIDFGEHGIKKLLARFAKLRML